MKRYKELFLIVIVLWSVMRFWHLEMSPPGFSKDEAVGATQIICLQQEGKTADGQKIPLFATGNYGGFYTPAYLYFGVLWTTVFGHSIASFRAIAALYTVVAIIGLYFLSRLFGGREFAVYAALAGAISPWSFQFSRIAWDPPVMVCFMVWGMYFFLRTEKTRDLVLSAIFLSLAMYSYPTARVQVPLLILVLVWMKMTKKTLRIRGFFLFTLVGIVVCLPLIILTLNGELQGRFNNIGFFSREYTGFQGDFGLSFSESLMLMKAYLRSFLKKILIHFNPDFLFFAGDNNLRHSTGNFGEWSWLDILALILVVPLIVKDFLGRIEKKEWKTTWVNQRHLLVLVFCGYISGIVPAALTWEALPHALRSIGSWPFLSLFTAIVFYEMSKRFSGTRVLVLLVTLVYSGIFFFHYFSTYPGISSKAFNTKVKNAAISAKKKGDWKEFISQVDKARLYPDNASRYYLMYYADENCSDSLLHLQKLRQGQE